MTLASLIDLLKSAPLIASVQASDGSPTDDPEVLLPLAKASLAEGVKVLRLQGVNNIRRIKSATCAPVVGLIKRRYAGSEVYITPTAAEVDALIELGCEVIAIDGTPRERPEGASLPDLIERIHRAGRLAMADVDHPHTAALAIAFGADIVSTTLSGYTADTRYAPDAKVDIPNPATPHVERPIASHRQVTEPDLWALRELRSLHDKGIGARPWIFVGEGRFSEPWQLQAALRIGASAVVVGGAINDPVKQTRRFVGVSQPLAEKAGAVDIGGTWLRVGVVTAQGDIVSHERVPVPRTAVARAKYINDWASTNGIDVIGISAGGIIDPSTGEVIYSKPVIPDHVGTIFSRDIHAAHVFALNDGHATAWAHALHPNFAGLRVATLALGTGVGFGLVDRGRIVMGRRGQHARINDTPTRKGKIFEDLLGGASLTPEPSQAQIEDALEASSEAVRLIHTLYYPDVIVMAGGVGLQPWMQLERFDSLVDLKVVPSPYGPDAGLIGAGLLALYPPPID